MQLGEQCEHGRLKRQCPLCERGVEIAELRVENERNAEQVHELASENEELREKLERLDRDRERLQARWEELYGKYLACQERLERLVFVAEELTDLMQGVIDGDYEPDSFTLQPMKQALAALGSKE